MLESWRRAVGGERPVVLVTGEAGVGKTRLVGHVAQTELPDHALVLYGRCDEGQGIPYQPWRELLRDYAQVAPRGLLRPHAAELARLVPGLTHRLGSLPAPTARDPDSDRYILFEAVASLFAAASERAPVLVVLDDLHWADRPTLLLLKHLIATGPAGRLMLVGTYRASDIAPDHPVSDFAADLRREPRPPGSTWSGSNRTTSSRSSRTWPVTRSTPPGARSPGRSTARRRATRSSSASSSATFGRPG